MIFRLLETGVALQFFFSPPRTGCMFARDRRSLIRILVHNPFSQPWQWCHYYVEVEFCLVASFLRLANCSPVALAGIAGVPATALPPACAPNLASTLASRWSLQSRCFRSFVNATSLGISFLLPPPSLQISNIVVMHASSHIVAKRMVIVCGFSQHLGFISSVRRPSVGERRGLFFFPVSLEALLWQKNCFHLQVGRSRYEKLACFEMLFPGLFSHSIDFLKSIFEDFSPNTQTQFNLPSSYSLVIAPRSSAKQSSEISHIQSPCLVCVLGAPITQPSPSWMNLYIAHFEKKKYIYTNIYIYVKMRTPTGYMMYCNFERWLLNARL